MIGDRKTVEFGDYQTPIEFVLEVCKYLKDVAYVNPSIIIEPTFGLGSFINGSLNVFDTIKHVFGVEINTTYYNKTKEQLATIDKAIELNLFNDNIFTFDFDNIKKHISKEDNLLIIGNPPWVTNSELTSIGSKNIPFKDNFKDLKGLDAITGKGNFDVAEYIILQILNEFRNCNCYVAMLCKNIVARNIVRDLKKYPFYLADIKLLTFNTSEIFDINCEAGLLIMKLGNEKEKKLICNVYKFDNPTVKTKMFGWVNGKFISDIDNYNYNEISLIDGVSPLEWRQGIKHDCSKVMELSKRNDNGMYINGLKEEVDIEDIYVYKVLKSSDLKTKVITDTRKCVIVPQKSVKEETDSIREKSPKLWEYLNAKSNFLDNRKSSIYKNAPKFSIFGIGDYSFKPYKVAVSGFYKEPIFILAYGERPIMLDDTCYFLGFDEYKLALITMLLLNSNLVQDFIKSIAFLDSKRPYTKDILMRIDLVKVSRAIRFEQLRELSYKLMINFDITEFDYIEYEKYLSNNTENNNERD